MSQHNYDIVFCNLPPLSLERVYSAPAVLKTVVQSAGYRARCFDFSMDLFNACGRDLSLLESINLSFTVNQQLPELEQNILEKFLDSVVNTLIESQSKYYGFTVFSIWTHLVATKLILKLKELGLNDKIVLGGRGLIAEPYYTVHEFLSLSSDEIIKDFGSMLVDRNYVKHVIKGDGEDAVLDFLSNNHVEPTMHINAKFKTWHPNYDDYDFSSYLWSKDQRVLEVTGSTGCVRNCDFCDVKKNFGKFSYKDGEDLANELIYNQQKYNVNVFHHTDSLVNGGMKPFKMFLAKMAEHNANAKIPITWAGFYICRDVNEHHAGVAYFELLKKAGASGLSIGAESGSNRVLDAMDKKSTVESLFFELGQFRKYDITAQILSFVGHWREEHQDFVEHCKMLIKMAPYIRSGTIVSILLGYPYKMLRNTPAFYNIDIIKDPADYDIWIARSNRGNTLKTRMQRRLIVSKLSNALNIGVEVDEASILNQSTVVIETNREKINSFFEQHAKGNSAQYEAIANADSFVSEILDYKKTLDIDLVIQASSVNSDPHIRIELNNTVLFDSSLTEGEHSFKFTVDRSTLGATGTFKVSLTNKDQFDTLVDEHGNILKDKFITIKHLLIDDCDLLLDVDFFQQNFKYNSNINALTPTMWENNSLMLEFKLPFVWWYSTTSRKNTKNELATVYNSLNDESTVNNSRHRLEIAIKSLTI